MKRKSIDIEEIYDSFSRGLYFTALRLLGNPAEAEDAMQESILKYYDKAEKEEIENIGGWLRRVCVRKCLDILRRRERKSAYDQEISFLAENSEPELYSGAESAEETPIIQLVMKLIAYLPNSCRTTVSLKLIEGYDYEEIAQITGDKESSIRSQYMRGRQHLVQLLKKEGINYE
ncbi:MAG: RNA polymerase sigma factor [Bacteroidales bacterium]|nr:RNA polymerase sigma factor [Bacteroidales bacterium]